MKNFNYECDLRGAHVQILKGDDFIESQKDRFIGLTGTVIASCDKYCCHLVELDDSKQTYYITMNNCRFI